VGLRRRSAATLLAGGILALGLGVARAAPADADVELTIGASTRSAPPTIIGNGGTATVSSRTFFVFLNLDLISPTPGGQVKVRAELGGGLRWGPDDPDPTELCTSTPTTGECTSGDLQPTTGLSGGGWYWDVVAPTDGTYTFRAEIISAPDVDPVVSNNSSAITIVVSAAPPPPPPPPSSPPPPSVTRVTASAAKLTPAQPRAGTPVTASVRVTAGGAAVRPTAVACGGSVGSTKLRGAAKAAAGVASCRYRTPASAKGKILRGTVSFTARGKRFTKRFAATLR
jgi:hypothetical protein